MSALYGAADVFVLASTVEPYGTVYGEAMAAGLPVVGWAAGNLPHLAADGVEGRVVPTGDVAGLSAALGARGHRRGAPAPAWARRWPAPRSCRRGTRRPSASSPSAAAPPTGTADRPVAVAETHGDGRAVVRRVSPGRRPPSR